MWQKLKSIRILRTILRQVASTWFLNSPSHLRTRWFSWWWMIKHYMNFIMFDSLMQHSNKSWNMERRKSSLFSKFYSEDITNVAAYCVSVLFLQLTFFLFQKSSKVWYGVKVLSKIFSSINGIWLFLVTFRFSTIFRMNLHIEWLYDFGFLINETWVREAFCISEHWSCHDVFPSLWHQMCLTQIPNYICLNEKQNLIHAFSGSNNLLQGFSLFSPIEMCVVRCFPSQLRLHHTTACRCRQHRHHRYCHRRHRLHPHNFYWYYNSIQRSLNVFTVNMSH